ncbi:hypothetical protein NKR23_g12553 [Pleurostoma richardsiae]|uniref:Uncharacterized protein n=1 Tax=Pleurostoma richardsiae TaxID=41990 RepID=A0AA38RFB9_9PEZI|nr:hypothetical protein NKR23_g12553 [Pleurostoma richardsiae]
MDQAEHLKVHQLGEEERKELIDAVPAIKQLLVPDGPVEVCRDGLKLMDACAKFIAQFKPWEKFRSPSKIIAVRLVQPSKIPVDAPYLLIPAEPSGDAEVAGQTVEPGSYLWLTRDVDVKPRSLFLLLKADT